MTSQPDFGANTTGTEVAELFAEEIRGRNGMSRQLQLRYAQESCIVLHNRKIEDWEHLQLTSTIVVITGVSPNSLGGTLALTIAKHQPHDLVLASRSQSNLQKVQEQLFQRTGVLARLVVLDLASQSSIREAAQEVMGAVTHIDILINNAGVTASDRRLTSDGLELQFGVNHIGHFLLTNLLMPKLLASESPRVVNVTSLGYNFSPFRFHDYNFEGQAVPPEEEASPGFPESFTPKPEEGRPYTGFCAYGQSKTANILHVVSLNERYGKLGLKAYAVHPGSKSSIVRWALSTDADDEYSDQYRYVKKFDAGRLCFHRRHKGLENS